VTTFLFARNYVEGLPFAARRVNKGSQSHAAPPRSDEQLRTLGATRVTVRQ
jgi:hypothetical protein